MAKVIVGTQGRINELLLGIAPEDILHFYVNNDKAWVIVKDDATFMKGDVIEKEVIKEVIKNDPKIESELLELKDLLEFKDDELKQLKDSLSDSLNAEQEAKKMAEECKIALEKEKAKYANEIEKLKAQVKKLKAAITAE